MTFTCQFHDLIETKQQHKIKTVKYGILGYIANKYVEGQSFNL